MTVTDSKKFEQPHLLKQGVLQQTVQGAHHCESANIRLSIAEAFKKKNCETSLCVCVAPHAVVDSCSSKSMNSTDFSDHLRLQFN